MRTLLSLVTGMAGVVLLMCEAESMTALLLSKVAAIVLLVIAARGLLRAAERGELDTLKKYFDHEE